MRVHAYFLKVCMRLQQLSRNACTRTKELVRRNFFKKSFYLFGSFRVCTVRVGCFRVGLRDFFFWFRGFGVGCFGAESLELETCGCVFGRLAEGAVSLSESSEKLMPFEGPVSFAGSCAPAAATLLSRFRLKAAIFA